MKLSISNFLIIFSVIITILSYLDPGLRNYGMNHGFFLNDNYYGLILQFILYSFLHGGFIHLLFNSVFIGYFGNILEQKIGKINFLIMFLLSTIINGISVLYFTQIGTNTIGISGFCLSLLVFYTCILYENKNPEYKGGITAIVVNLFIGIMPNISMVGHVSGAIFGLFYYLLYSFISKRIK